MSKAVLITIVVILLLGVLIVLACGSFIGGLFWLTQAPADAANRFIVLVGEGKTKEAYASASTLLRNQQTEADFAEAVKKMGLLDAASSSWTSRSIVNSEATLEGTVTTKKGGTIPIKAKLVKEGEEWRIVELTVPAAQVKVDDNKPTLPADAELRKLATAALIDFEQGVKTQDFTSFYNKTAKLWQNQTTPAELKKSLQPFIDEKHDLSAVKDTRPEFSEPPGINADKVLVLTGYVPGKPERVNFTLRYVYEHPAWKLIGIHVVPKDEKPAKE